jgi:hypothetical protein
MSTGGGGGTKPNYRTQLNAAGDASHMAREEDLIVGLMIPGVDLALIHE